MNCSTRGLVALLVSSLFTLCASGAVVTGTMETWHKLTFTFDGPESSEMAAPNPFLDCRLRLTFENEGGLFQIFGPSVGARSDDRLVNRHVTNL